MAYIDVADLADAESFRRRLATALVMAASDVLTGAPKTQATWQNKRYELALNVIRDPYNIVPAFVWPIVADATIGSQGLASTDAQLKDRTLLVWDYVAGVTAADKV